VQLFVTGEFYKRPVEEAPKGDRRSPIKHKDNLFPEGQFYSPEKAPAPGPGDRGEVRKPKDNLRLEGVQEPRVKSPAPLKGERAPMKRPVDNITTPDGKFSERSKEQFHMSERRTQIRHEDTLKLEGKFYHAVCENKYLD
jgi:hypothetical protein